jgi:AcrR family transcriptional regulator
LDRARVIQEAARLIDEERLDHLSLGRLAARLGVRVPSLYNHIAGLPGLKRDLALYCLRDLLGLLRQAVADRSGAEAILALLEAYRDYARRMPGRYCLTLQVPAPGDSEWQQMGEHIAEMAGRVLASYRLDAEATIQAIGGLRMLIEGAISLETAGAFAIPLRLDESICWMTRLYLAGLEQAKGERWYGTERA